MSLLSALNAGVKAAHNVLNKGKLECTVSYKRATTNTGSGIGEAAAVELKAVVDYRTGQNRVDGGIVRPVRATILLLDVAAVAVATNGRGIQSNDVFILPDGSTGPILGIDGFMPLGSGELIATTVSLG